MYFDAVTGEELSGEEKAAAQRVFQISSKEAVYKDSVTGQPLEQALVQAARKLELEYFESKLVWVRRPRAEALAKTGKSPIAVRWIDTNRGDDESPNYRNPPITGQGSWPERSGKRARTRSLRPRLHWKAYGL